MAGDPRKTPTSHFVAIEKDIESLQRGMVDLRTDARKMDDRLDAIERELVVIQSTPAPVIPLHKCEKTSQIKDHGDKIEAIAKTKAKHGERLSAINRRWAVITAVATVIIAPSLGAAWCAASSTGAQSAKIDAHGKTIHVNTKAIQSNTKAIQGNTERLIMVERSGAHDTKVILDEIRRQRAEQHSGRLVDVDIAKSRLKRRVDRQQLDELLRKAGM